MNGYTHGAKRPQDPSRAVAGACTPRHVVARAGSHEAAELKRKLVAVRPPRQVAPPPEQVAVEHSATYLLRSRRPLDEEEDLLASSARSRSDEPFSGNAVEWYLRRIDRSVDDSDAEPSPAAKAYYRASQTQAGSSAASGVGSVVGTAAKLGASAVKAAAPIGKWAVMQGLGAAGRMIAPTDRKKKKQKD